MDDKHPKRPRDLNQWAKRMTDIVSGEVEDREPTPEEQGKDPEAVKRGKLGGAKGGKARAVALDPVTRQKIARKAASARWATEARPAVTRLTGASKTTVTKLLVDAGSAAAWYQDRVFQGLECKRLQVDEIWGFVGTKQRNATAEKKEKRVRPVTLGCGLL